MASIQTRFRSDGTTAYRVMFRLSGRLVGETFDDPKAAQQFSQLVDRLGGAAARELRDARDDFTDAVLLRDWLEDHVERLTGVTDGTKRDYRAAIKHHINPTLGDYPLEALSRRQLELWVNTLTPTMAAKTLRNVQSILSAALERAVREDLIPANPAKGVRLPPSDHHKVEMVTLTANEFTQFYGAFPARWQPLIVTMAGTGMRWGEITALPVGACDLDADIPSVRVQQAWKRTGRSSRELGPPKTRKGRRTISLSPALADQLRPLVEGRPADAFVFTGVKGGPIDHAHFYERVWKPALREFAGDVKGPDGAGQKGPGKRPRIHDLRHTHATWMAARISLPRLQRRLGHESIQTTVDTYGHAMPDDLGAAADAIGELLAGALPTVEPDDVRPRVLAALDVAGLEADVERPHDAGLCGHEQRGQADD
jgi:integrase